MIRAVHGVKQTNERLFIISYESLSFLLIFLMLALEEKNKYRLKIFSFPKEKNQVNFPSDSKILKHSQAV